MTDLLDRPRTTRTRASRPPGGDRPRVDPRIAQRWVEARRQEGRRRLRILLVVLTVAAIGALVVGSLYTPIFEVSQVRVTLAATPGAAVPVSTAEVRSEAGLDGHPLMIDLNPVAVERRLDANPLLGGARVVKHWPGTVSVSVAERSPLAQVATGAAGSGYVPVDATGRVLGPASAAPAAGLPVLQGLGPVPPAGGWLPGSAGAGAYPTGGPSALVDMTAASDSSSVPRAPAAALAFLDALPAGLRATVQSVTAGSGPDISLTVAPTGPAAGIITVDLGDGSQLGAKVTAFETLLGQADLTGVTTLDLSVPGSPAATMATAPSGSSPSSSPSSAPSSGSGAASASGSTVPAGTGSTAGGSTISTPGASSTTGSVTGTATGSAPAAGSTAPAGG